MEVLSRISQAADTGLYFLMRSMIVTITESLDLCCLQKPASIWKQSSYNTES